MFYNLLAPLSDKISLFNLFNYVSVRASGAIFTSLVISFFIGPPIIRWLISKQGEGQPIRNDGPQSHLAKHGTPTMGGLMILISMIISTFLWADLKNSYTWLIIFVTLSYGGIGFADDYLKLTKRDSKGLSGKMKLTGQILVAMIAAGWYIISTEDQYATYLAFPFVKDYLLPLGMFFIPFAVIVMVGSGNAVNLTDGLDGLAITPVMMAAGSLGIIAYLTGNIIFSEYLNIPYIEGAHEATIICAAMIGAGLGFLWYNAPPAMVFMGDTGSLAMGGALGTIAIIAKHEIVFTIIGGLFVLETISVIVQVASFKLTGKRIFRMAPLHHHFEEKGWSESTIVIRFWIIALLLAIIGLATLKLR